MGALFALLLALANGWLFTYLALPLQPRSARRAAWVGVGSLAVGFGVALSSATYLLWLAGLQAWRHGLLLIDGACLIVFGALAWRKHQSARGTSAPPRRASLWERLATLIFVGLMLVTMLGFASNALHNPHGGWDAWAIWNLRARFLFRGAAHWWEAFSETLAWSHPDYPLLLPGAIARAWQYGGQETQAVPALIGFLFTFATVGLTVWSVGRLRGRFHGLLAGLVLLATPVFLQHGASQYAEPPLAFYFLATLVLLALAEASPKAERYRWLFLAALSAGCGAWTKNEGVLFLLAVLAVHATRRVWWGDRRWSRPELTWVGVGMAGPTLLLVVFKKALAPANDVIGAQTMGSLASRLLDPARHAQIASAYWDQLNRFGHGMAVGMAVFMLLAGRDRSRRGARSAWAVVGLMLAGYYGVYLITPRDLGWHLVTSLERLFLQLWPCAVFAGMLGARGIEDRSAAADDVLSSRPEGLPPVPQQGA